MTRWAKFRGIRDPAELWTTSSTKSLSLASVALPCRATDIDDAFRGGNEIGMELASICRRAHTPGSKYRYSFAIAERDRWFACRARANCQLHPGRAGGLLDQIVPAHLQERMVELAVLADKHGFDRRLHVVVHAARADATLNGLDVETKTMEPSRPRKRGGMSVAPRIVSRQLAFVEDRSGAGDSGRDGSGCGPSRQF